MKTVVLRRIPYREAVLRAPQRGIYIVFDAIGEAFYAGQSRNVPGRLRIHLSSTRPGMMAYLLKHRNVPFSRSLVDEVLTIWTVAWTTSSKLSERDAFRVFRPKYGPLVGQRLGDEIVDRFIGAILKSKEIIQ